MTLAGKQTFVTNEVTTAEKMNNLVRQGIQIFQTRFDRTTIYSVNPPNMNEKTYLVDEGVLERWDGTKWTPQFPDAPVTITELRTPDYGPIPLIWPKATRTSPGTTLSDSNFDQGGWRVEQSNYGIRTGNWSKAGSTEDDGVFHKQFTTLPIEWRFELAVQPISRSCQLNGIIPFVVGPALAR